MNSSYQVVKTISAGNGQSADLHEFQLTPQGTALITAETPVYTDGTAVHGVVGEVVLDSVVQEIDIPTGLVLFQWDSLDHVPLTAGYTVPPNAPKKKGKAPLPNFSWDPYDYFHLNSVGLDRDGNLVISSRNTWAVYKVNHRTGAIMWTLGGKSSSFKLGAGASFAFQHDVRVRAAGDQTRDHVRRRRRAAVRALPVARARAPPELQAHDRDRAPPARALPAAALGLRGRRPAAARRRRLRRLGPAAVLQPVQREGQAGLRRAVRRLQPDLPRLSLRLERDTGHAAVGRSPRATAAR